MLKEFHPDFVCPLAMEKLVVVHARDDHDDALLAIVLGESNVVDVNVGRESTVTTLKDLTMDLDIYILDLVVKSEDPEVYAAFRRAINRMDTFKVTNEDHVIHVQINDHTQRIKPDKLSEERAVLLDTLVENTIKNLWEKEQTFTLDRATTVVHDAIQGNRPAKRAFMALGLDLSDLAEHLSELLPELVDNGVIPPDAVMVSQ